MATKKAVQKQCNVCGGFLKKILQIVTRYRTITTYFCGGCEKIYEKENKHNITTEDVLDG